MKQEDFSSERKGKRQYLEPDKQKAFFDKLSACFKSKIEVPRKNVGARQEFESLICEETLRLGR